LVHPGLFPRLARPFVLLERPNSGTMPGMVSLSDTQLRIVMDAAAMLETSWRDTYLQRIAAMLRLRRRFDDSDVAEVSKLALCGLVHRTNDAA
jgi:hypothetical protein